MSENAHMRRTSRKRRRSYLSEKKESAGLDQSTDYRPIRSRRRIAEGASSSSTIQSQFLAPIRPARAACDDRRKFDVPRFERLVQSMPTSSSQRPFRSGTRQALQMITSAFNQKNLRTAFLLNAANASRSNAVSLDHASITRFSNIIREHSSKHGFILAHASDRALAFCNTCLQSPKINTNYASQAVLALQFHPCIGLPSSRMRITADAIAKVAVKKLRSEQQCTVLQWLIHMPRDVLLRIVRFWVQHITWSWLAQNSPMDIQRNARGPVEALHWLRLIRWACRVQERDSICGRRPDSGSYLNEADFYAPQISRQLNVSRLISMRYASEQSSAAPSSAFVNHEYIFDATSKAQMIRYEAKRRWNELPRQLSTENKIVENYISALRLPVRLEIEVRRDRVLEDAIAHLASTSTAEKIQMDDARRSAIESITRSTPGVLLGSEQNAEEENRRVNQVRRHVERLMDRELIKFIDMCFEVPMKIRFRGEPGVDEGGLSRHFFEIVARQACDAQNNPLFLCRGKSSPCVWFPGFKNEQEYLESSGQIGTSQDSFERYQWFGVILGLAVKSKCQIGIQLPTILFEFLQHDRFMATLPTTKVSKKERSKIGLPLGGIPWHGLDRVSVCRSRKRMKRRVNITNHALSGDSSTHPEPFLSPTLRSAAREIDPDLLRGVDALLAYGDGNAVQDVFCLDHTVTLDRLPVDRRSSAPSTPLDSASLVPFLPDSTLAKGQGRSHSSSRVLSTDPVTGKNRARYAHAYLSFHVFGAHMRRIDAVRIGFRRITSAYHSIQMCSPPELQLAICGKVKIDVEEILRSARYAGGYNASCRQVRWLSEILLSYNEEYKKMFYLFVTGSSVVPCGGVAQSAA